MISLKTVRTEPVAEERAHGEYDVASGEAGGKLMVTRGTGRRVREALAEALEGLPSGGVLYVDTRGVELMDYSFADEALGILASRVAAGGDGGRGGGVGGGGGGGVGECQGSLRQR